MANKPAKVRVITLDPKSMGLVPQYESTETDIETPVNAPDPQNTIPVPAVTFGYNRVACADGTMVENGHIYDTFLKINEECLNTSVDALQSKEVSYPFLAASINIEAEATYKIIQNSYRSAITSHWYNFVSLFNYYIDTFTKGKYPNNPSCNAELDNENIYHLGYYIPYGFKFDGTLDFIRLPYKERDNVISSGALHAHISASINSVGVHMYEMAYERLCKALSITSMNSDNKEDLLKKAIEMFNCMFAELMANITYEGSVFYLNLVNFHSMIPSMIEIKKIKNLGGETDYDSDYFGGSVCDRTEF